MSHSALTKVWLILLLNAGKKAGLLPIQKDQLHQIIFLSNCLAPLFEKTPEAARIVKYKRGPYYPVVQWTLDHLAISGAIEVTNTEYITDKFGIWLTAKYSVNETTTCIVEHCTSIKYGKELNSYLTELIFSYAALNQKTIASIANSDKTYSTPGKGLGSMIDYSEASRNLSVKTANRFAQYAPAGIQLNPRDELALYLKFLEGMLKEAAV